MNNSLYIDKELLSSNEIIEPYIKTRTLNVLRDKLITLSKQTEVTAILDIIQTLLKLIEDAYRIDMYKFSLKIFSKEISEEIKNLEELING